MVSSNELGVPSTATISPSTGVARLRFQNNQSNDENEKKEQAQAIVMNASSRVHKDRNFLLIGRQAATCDVRITHKSLSRQHAVLYYEQQQNNGNDHPLLMVQDLKTKSGTWVDQVRLAPNTPTILKEGCVVQFGKAEPSFEVEYETVIPVKNGGGSNTATKQEEKEEIQDHNTEPSDGENGENDKSTVAATDIEEPMTSLTGRAARQAEIAAMMASLEEAPAYTKYQLTDKEQREESERLKQLKQQQEVPKQDDLHPMIEKYKLPFPETSSCSQTVSSESSVISSLAMDPSGSRFALAHMDSSMQLYDFAGWSSSSEATPFSNLLVSDDSHAITSVTYSPNGERFIVSTHSAQPKVFDKEGEEILQWVRGDVYVMDPAKTIGHTAAVVSVAWHAVDKSIVFSASQDGSLRVWNVDKGKLAFGMLKCQDVILLKNPRTGRRTLPTCMVMMGPSSIWLGTECGSIQRYQYPFVSKLRPQQSTMVPEAASDDDSSSAKTINKLANKEHAIRSIAVSGDGTKVAARTDKAVHVYTNSSLYRLTLSSSPLLTIPLEGDGVVDAESGASSPTMAFSPNNKTLCVGITRTVQSDEGNKKYYETRLQLYSIPKESITETKIKKKPIYSMPLVELQYPLVGLVWHPKLNQILVATTKEFQVCYSIDFSKKGMLLNLRQRTSSKRKRARGEDALQEIYTSRAPPPGTVIREEEIIAPNTLPLFGGQGNRKKKLKERQEEQYESDMARHKPQPPVKGVYNTNNTMFAQMVMDNQTAKKKQIAGMDPREALAQYSEGKSYIGKAYEGNKERILADKTVEEEEDAMNK
ncbi:unnamed protein product [Cylindrotheca closterium]|uniref:FHA domain-containing protein n=1 Tax=Cylindrotheca closterium TaxID=2856 RepID=A0AAD2CHY4_9STRA|nr:unnamed protein product [Cylindrotheca closterium]